MGGKFKIWPLLPSNKGLIIITFQRISDYNHPSKTSQIIINLKHRSDHWSFCDVLDTNSSVPSAQDIMAHSFPGMKYIETTNSQHNRYETSLIHDSEWLIKYENIVSFERIFCSDKNRIRGDADQCATIRRSCRFSTVLLIWYRRLS